MDNLVIMLDHIETKGFQLEAPGNLRDAVDTFLVHYSALARLSMESGELLWSITPKFHFLMHLAQQAMYEHPRIYWNYSGETFAGAMAAMAHRCLPGKPIHALTKPFTAKYRVSLHLRLERDFGR